MNTANKLTIFRVILVPFFVLFMLCDITDYSRLIALILFVVATITDHLDGAIARKYNMITSFGKFMDPIADKLLVSSALICLTSLGEMPAWAVIIIILREFAVSGIRLVAADNGAVIAAAGWGKAKTVAQMVMIIIFLLKIPQLYILSQISLYTSIILTVVSMVDYLIKNKSVIKFK
ncbi:MAG: CDP-diacylglycerol--glycerol-3-phosphate 3-phosphatidyltransferase [Clostridia bacterium]|nr:CDP-diacylglycerol--glycerol-3-phosphate 3-phosphatidyltransferase [Clostridia bacterium]